MNFSYEQNFFPKCVSQQVVNKAALVMCANLTGKHMCHAEQCTSKKEFDLDNRAQNRTRRGWGGGGRDFPTPATFGSAPPLSTSEFDWIFCSV